MSHSLRSLANDSCFQRKAAILKSLDRSVVDFTTYNETFAGHWKAIPHFHSIIVRMNAACLATYSNPDVRDISCPPRAHTPLPSPSLPPPPPPPRNASFIMGKMETTVLTCRGNYRRAAARSISSKPMTNTSRSCREVVEEQGLNHILLLLSSVLSNFKTIPS